MGSPRACGFFCSCFQGNLSLDGKLSIAMNIVLTGYRCTGKTSVGRILAGALGRRFLDTDMMIEEKERVSIGDIISSHGWPYFREIEARVIKEISTMDRLVVATGGGVVMDGENVANLRRNGWMVWLTAEPEVVKERMVGELETGIKRPSLTGGRDPLREIEDTLDKRRLAYRDSADFKVDTSKLSIQEVAERIMESIPNAVKQGG